MLARRGQVAVYSRSNCPCEFKVSYTLKRSPYDSFSLPPSLLSVSLAARSFIFTYCWVLRTPIYVSTHTITRGHIKIQHNLNVCASLSRPTIVDVCGFYYITVSTLVTTSRHVNYRRHRDTRDYQSSPIIILFVVQIER